MGGKNYEDRGCLVQRFRVCVTDDCVDEVSVLCEGLEMYGYEALPAYNGEEALDLCAKGMVDLLLLDVIMPGIDGYEVCRRLKSNPLTAEIPVIFVTAKGSPRDVEDGFSLGAVDFIAKPFNLPMVMMAVETAMRTRHNNKNYGISFDLINDTIYTDDLTGLRNRRFLLERLQEEISKAHRYNYPVSCLVLDIAEVRALDRELGCASDDELLVQIAMMIRSASRNYDILARFDDVQFAAVLPHASLQDALSYARKLKEEIASTTFSDPCFPTAAELSFGIVSCRNGSARGAEQILAEAMRNLFKANTVSPTRIVARDLNESGAN
jgi:diguanylate cyclase (GGDEF)-like protein